MRKCTFLFVVLLLLAFGTPAWAADDLNLIAKRNSDNSVTIRWDPHYGGSQTLSINVKVDGASGSLIKGIIVPVSAGCYIDSMFPVRNPKTSFEYRVEIKEQNFYRNLKVGVYQPTPVNDTGETDPNASLKGMKDKLAEAERNAGYLEKFCAEIVMLIPRFVKNVLDITDPIELAYNRSPNNAFAPIEGLHLYTFTNSEYRAIETLYDSLRKMIPVPLTIAIVIMGYMIILNSTNSSSRVTYRDYVSGLFICVMLLEFAHYLWEFIFAINYYMVEIFYSSIEGVLTGTGIFDTLCKWDTTSLGMALLTFITVIVFSMLNWQFALRKIMLAILLLIFPVVAIAGVFPQTRNTLNIWLKELLSNLFMQTGYAAALAVYILFNENGVSFWIMFAFLMGLTTVAMLVRRVMGAESIGGGSLGAAGSMLGLGSVMALSRIGQGIMGKRGTASPALDMLANQASQSAATSGIAAGAGGTLSRAVSGIAKGAALTTTALAGGALAGMSTGNPGIGLAVGGYGGTLVAGKVNQISDFVNEVSQGAKETGQSFVQTAANRLGIYDKGQIYDGESAAQIGRNIMGGGTLGSVGALAGRGISTAANIAQGLMPVGKTSPSYQVGQNLEQFRNRVSNDVVQAQRNLTSLMPQYETAKLQMEQAKSPAHYPDPVERNLKIEEVQNKLQSISGQMADSKLTIMDGNFALSNEGIKHKIETIKTAQGNERVNGGINGHMWN